MSALSSNTHGSAGDVITLNRMAAALRPPTAELDRKLSYINDKVLQMLAQAVFANYSTGLTEIVNRIASMQARLKVSPQAFRKLELDCLGLSACVRLLFHDCMPLLHRAPTIDDAMRFEESLFLSTLDIKNSKRRYKEFEWNITRWNIDFNQSAVPRHLINLTITVALSSKFFLSYVESLWRAGANFNSCDGDQLLVIHHLIASNGKARRKKRILNFLLTKGLDPNIVKKKCLIQAAPLAVHLSSFATISIPIVRTLVAGGMDLNVVHNGQTPLETAVQLRRLDLIRCFIFAGACLEKNKMQTIDEGVSKVITDAVRQKKLVSDRLLATFVGCPPEISILIVTYWLTPAELMKLCYKEKECERKGSTIKKAGSS